MAESARLGPLGFGGAPLGNMFVEVSDEDAFAVLDEAWNAGVRYFDTAPHYGLGLSERRLGAFLQTKPRDEYVLSTKVGRLVVPNAGGASVDLDSEFRVPATSRRAWDFSADGVRRSLDASLDRLGLDRVDILYLHDPERSDVGLDRALETATPALRALRDQGMVGRIGIGSMVNTAIVAAVRTGALDLAMVANRLTLLDHSALDEVAPVCAAARVELVAAAVFNSGLLATDEATGHFDYREAPAEMVEQARRIAAVCRNHGVELPTAALQFPLRHGAAAVVVGANAPGQLTQNVSRLDVSVPDALWAELAAEGLAPA